MNNKHQKCFFWPLSHINNKIEQFRAKNKIKVFNLHFDSHFISCSYKGEFRFFHLNLLVINFYFWFAMLTEINPTIVKISSGIFIVTVYKKRRTSCI